MGRSVDRPPDRVIATAASVDVLPGTRVGEYVIAHKLGEGGMASVYGAVHPVIEKRAAVKILSHKLSADRGQVARFIQEARAVNAIGHPNIVDVFGFGFLPDGRAYYLMQWLHGETLHQRIWERRRLQVAEAIDILEQMCDALEAAHDKGIVHRDLKPANVFLEPARGRRDLVKLLDFGVAKLLSDEARAPRTLSGQVVGTPEYIAPEQARGLAVDGRTDIYALGVLAYEMLLGRLPFSAEPSSRLIELHLTAPPPPLRGERPEVPPRLERLVLAMLEKDPARRPRFDEIRAGLRELRATPLLVELPDSGRLDMGALSPRALLPTQPDLPRGRAGLLGRLSLVALVVVALLAAGLSVAVIERRLGPEPPERACTCPPR